MNMMMMMMMMVGGIKPVDTVSSLECHRGLPLWKYTRSILVSPTGNEECKDTTDASSSTTYADTRNEMKEEKEMMVMKEEEKEEGKNALYINQSINQSIN